MKYLLGEHGVVIGEEVEIDELDNIAALPEARGFLGVSARLGVLRAVLD